MDNTTNLNDIFVKSYLNEYTERERQKIQHNQEEREIAKQKFEQLEGMIKFLDKFVELEILVDHSDQHTKNALTNEGRDPQKFQYYLVDSSKKWSPGTSIFFDHPAQVEIAIPNYPQKEGVIVIKVASHHPYAYIVEQKFTTFESAYEAIARFLGKSTVKISKDPKKYIKESHHVPAKKPEQQYDFTQNVPEEPPQTENHPNSLNSLKKISEFFKFNKNSDDDLIEE